MSWIMFRLGEFFVDVENRNAMPCSRHGVPGSCVQIMKLTRILLVTEILQTTAPWVSGKSPNWLGSESSLGNRLSEPQNHF